LDSRSDIDGMTDRAGNPAKVALNSNSNSNEPAVGRKESIKILSGGVNHGAHNPCTLLQTIWVGMNLPGGRRYVEAAHNCGH